MMFKLLVVLFALGTVTSFASTDCTEADARAQIEKLKPGFINETFNMTLTSLHSDQIQTTYLIEGSDEVGPSNWILIAADGCEVKFFSQGQSE